MSFGNGPFGNSTFGHFPWSERMLWDYIPELNRQQDAEIGEDSLKKWTESQRYSFDRLLDKITNYTELHDPLTVPSKYTDSRKILLGTEVLPKATIEQRGVDGLVTPINEFYTKTGRFSQEHVGMVLAIKRSSVQGNNIECVVARVEDVNTIVTDPVLSPDAGKDRWELRPRTVRIPGTVTVQVRQGDVSEIGPGYILNDGFADYEVSARRLFPRSDDQKHLTEREGVDGFIGGSPSTFTFTSPNLGVTQQDIGKYLFIEGIDTDTPKRWIAAVVDDTTVNLGGTSEDDYAALAGTIRKWALLPFPELDLISNEPPKGVVEQEGLDLATTTGPSAFSSSIIRLTSDDVGKKLAIKRLLSYTSDAENFFITEIATVTGPTTGTITDVPDVDTAQTWELRSATDVSVTDRDNSFVYVRAPSMVETFGRNFGTQVDTVELDIFQRRWIKRLTAWIDRKGTAKAYNDVAKLTQVTPDLHPYDTTPQSATGFTANPEALFCPTPALYWEALAAGSGGFVGDIDEGVLRLEEFDVVGRTGADGSFIDTSDGVAFYSPTAVFKLNDESRVLRLARPTPAIVEVVEIVKFIDVNTVTIAQLYGDDGTVTTPSSTDADNGTIGWAVGQIYVTTLPARVLGDDVDTDLATEIVQGAFVAAAGASLVDGETFTIDDGTTSVVFEFDSNASVGGGNVAVTFTGGMTAAQVATAMITAINGSSSNVTAFNRSGGTAVSLSNQDPTLLSDTVASANFSNLAPVDPLPVFAPDYLCTAERFSVAAPVYIVSAVLVGLNVYEVNIVGTPWYLDTPEIVKTIGYWFIKDSSATEYFLESVPTANGTDGGTGRPKYKFQVKATEIPVVSTVTAATLDYDCPSVLSCDFCPTSKVLIDHAAPGQAAQRILSRLVETKPAHVDFVFRE